MLIEKGDDSIVKDQTVMKTLGKSDWTEKDQSDRSGQGLTIASGSVSKQGEAVIDDFEDQAPEQAPVDVESQEQALVEGETEEMSDEPMIEEYPSGEEAHSHIQ